MLIKGIISSTVPAIIFTTGFLGANLVILVATLVAVLVRFFMYLFLLAIWLLTLWNSESVNQTTNSMVTDKNAEKNQEKRNPRPVRSRASIMSLGTANIKSKVAYLKRDGPLSSGVIFGSCCS